MKGILFTLIFLLITSALIGVILVRKSLITYYGEKLAIETRANAIKNFYESIKEDAPKALEIVSRRALSSAVSWVVTQGIGLDEADYRIKELMINGTLNSTPEPLMENNLTTWVEKIEEIGEKLGIGTNLKVLDLRIKPYDSFDILIELDLQIDLSDEKTELGIEKNETIQKIVSIEGFEDPLYPLNTFGRVTNVIKKNPYLWNFTTMLISSTGNNSWFYGESIVLFNSTQIQLVENKSQKVLVTNSTKGIGDLIDEFGAVVCECDITGEISTTFVDNAANAMRIIPNNTPVLVDGENGKVWFIENLRETVEKSYYQPSLKGGSFLDRLEGKLEVQEKYALQSSNLIGLESFVDKNYIASYGLPVDEDKANIDHLYFSSIFYGGRKVKGLDPSFRIDEEICTFNKTHVELYGVNEILIQE